MNICTANFANQLKPEKLKGMSKKQLRNVKKTTVNKFGQVELANLYGDGSAKPKKAKSSRKQ